MCIKMLTFSDSPDCRVRYAVLSDVINGIIVIRIDEAGIPNCVIGSTITSIPLKTFFVTFDTDENKTIRLLGPIWFLKSNTIIYIWMLWLLYINLYIKYYWNIIIYLIFNSRSHSDKFWIYRSVSSPYLPRLISSFKFHYHIMLDTAYFAYKSKNTNIY